MAIVPDTILRLQGLTDELFPFRAQFFQGKRVVVRHVSVVDGHTGEDTYLVSEPKTDILAQRDLHSPKAWLSDLYVKCLLPV